MRVNIGPYRDWFGPYQLANLVFFWVRARYLYDPLEMEPERWDHKLKDKFGDWLANRKYLCRFLDWIDRFKQRKIDIRIDPYDTWSMDHTLALIILPMLIQLKKMNHGYFSSDPEDAPSIGKGKDGVAQDLYDDSYSVDRYNWIMDELIWTFEQLANPDYDHELFYKNGEWDIEGSQKYHERINNGLRLFGKYYRGLWD